MTQPDYCELVGNCICPVCGFLTITDDMRYKHMSQNELWQPCLEFCCCWLPCIPMPFTRLRVLEARKRDTGGLSFCLGNWAYSCCAYGCAIDDTRKELDKLPDV